MAQCPGAYTLIRIALIAIAGAIVILVGLFAYYIYVPSANEPSLSSEIRQHSLSVEGQDRRFLSYRPINLGEKTALIFVLHGSRGSGDQVRRSTAYEFDLLADQHGFIVVYPDGYENHWNDCRAMADYAANQEDIADPAFFVQMVQFFIEHEGIDPGQVFVAGHSNGGQMAYRLALEMPELVTAIAAISAGLPADTALDCKKSGTPISVAILNGTVDPINPYEGGLVSVMGNESRGEVLSSLDTASYWAGLSGNAEQAETIQYPEVDGNPSTSVLVHRWRGAGGLEVRLYRLEGSGHVIPSRLARFPRLLGGDAGDISGPEEIAMFFLSLSSRPES